MALEAKKYNQTETKDQRYKKGSRQCKLKEACDMMEKEDIDGMEDLFQI